MLLTRMQIDILVKLTDADTHYFSRSVERLKRANYAKDFSVQNCWKCSLIIQSFFLYLVKEEDFFSIPPISPSFNYTKWLPGAARYRYSAAQLEQVGLSAFYQGHHQRGLQEKSGRVTQTLPPAQSREGLLQSQVSNVFTFSSLKLHSQRNFTDLFQNCFLGFKYIYK